MESKEVIIGQTYCHIASMTFYKVVLISKNEANLSPLVSYEHAFNGHVYTRPMSEFIKKFDRVISSGEIQNEEHDSCSDELEELEKSKEDAPVSEKRTATHKKSRKQRIEDVALGFFISGNGRYQFSDCIDDADFFVSMIDERYPD